MAKKTYSSPSLKVQKNKTVNDIRLDNIRKPIKEGSNILHLLAIPLVIILYAVLCNMLIGGTQTYSFQGLIQYIQKAPSFDFAWLRSSTTLQFVSEWQILDGIRQFFNFLLNSFKSMIILSGGVLQAISGFIFVLGYFIGF